MSNRRRRGSERLAFLAVIVCAALAAVNIACGSQCARLDGPGAKRCVAVTCPKGSAVRDGVCTCDDGSALVLGACVGYDQADAFCGVTARTTAGGVCAPKTCPPGRALALEDGLCLAEKSTLADIMWTGDGATDRRARCDMGALVGRRGHALCLTGKFACGRGQTFQLGDAGALVGECVGAKPCGAGELLDEISGYCVGVVRGGGDYTIDVGAWARLAIGIDGGEGTNAFCAPIRAMAMWGGNTPHFGVELSFPTNDVTQVNGRLRPRPDTAPALLDVGERSLAQILAALRHLGGTATAAAVTLDVGCSPPTSSAPATENVALDGGTD